TGTNVTADSVDVAQGWNLIGSISFPVLKTHISSVPPGIATSNFFGYNSGYFASDSVNPGHAYWVKTTQSGKLFLSSTVIPPVTDRIKIIASTELPPPPPGITAGGTGGVPQEFGLGQNYPNPFN